MHTQCLHTVSSVQQCPGINRFTCSKRGHNAALSMPMCNAHYCMAQEEEDLPVVAQPGSPEPNENNPFLSGLQQSGISITGDYAYALFVHNCLTMVAACALLQLKERCNCAKVQQSRLHTADNKSCMFWALLHWLLSRLVHQAIQAV